MRQQEMMDALEAMVDGSDLASVILALARLCNEKAEHIRINTNPKDLDAKAWDRAARALDTVSTVPSIAQVSA